MTRQLFGRWLSLAHFDNTIIREQASLVRNLLLVLLIAVILGIPSTITAPRDATFTLTSIGSIMLTAASITGLVLIRRGHLRASVLTISFAMLLEIVMVIIPYGVSRGGHFLVALVIPLMLVSICASRNEAIVVAVISMVLLVALIGIEQNVPGLVGFVEETQWTDFARVMSTGTILFILLMFLDRFRSTFNQALMAATLREQALTEAQANLERLVSERTSQLEQALHESEQREIRLRDTLGALESSRQTVAALSSPVIPVAAGVLATPMIGVLDTGRVDQATEIMLQAVREGKAQFLILDVTGVPVVDMEAAEGILRIARSIRLLGAQAILTGIHPEIAQTLVAIGFDQDHIVTRSTLQEGISYALMASAQRSIGGLRVNGHANHQLVSS